MESKRWSRCFLSGVPRAARMFALATLAMLLVASVFAKMYEQPRSFSLNDKSQEQVERKILPKINIERLLAEDRARAEKPQLRPGPQRFAVAAEVSYTLDNSGTWQDLPDGRLWRLRIQSPGAKSINLGITRFEMSKGAKLWIYDPAHVHVEGPFTARNRSHLGSLWTPMIEGDEIVVEVFVPTGAAKPTIDITKINQGYRGLGTADKTGLFGASEGTCNNDVICTVGDPWRNQIRAVGVYTVNGTTGCTGTLMNNTAFDFRPYVLSANHCGVDNTNDATIVIYWNFESATCGTHGPGSTSDNQTGATYRASYAPSDFVLFELSAAPDPGFNVFFAGWDASGHIPASTVGIHHPRLDVKAISFSNSAPDTTAYYSTTHDASGNHWYVLWNSGVTEGGSSGSCLFETTNGRCIGQLHGGPSGCGGTDLHDYYGRLSVSWNGGGTAATRLRDWLDPVNSGGLTIDGDPHITTTNGVRYDLQGAGEFVSLRDPNGLEVQVRQEPVTTAPTPTDSHDGLATCVSLNTAVAARVGQHRVTYQPTLSGVPDPSGLQLRVDGTLTTLGANGIDLGNNGRISKTAASGGLQIDFPDDSTLLVTPGWWASQSKWYLNINLTRPQAATGGAPGTFPIGGIAGPVTAGNWLPALPDGTSMGPMPAALHDRYVDLYGKFANAWRVTNQSSLFDYASGTSTDSFTNRSWPMENPPCVVPNTPPVQAVSQAVSQQACRSVTDENMHRNCMFDVVAAGNTGFARTYLQTQRIRVNSTRTTVRIVPSRLGGPITVTAAVTQLAAPGRRVPPGSVQFMLDGRPVGRPVRLNARGEASGRLLRLNLGRHKLSAKFIPATGSAFLASTSRIREHMIGDRDNR